MQTHSSDVQPESPIGQEEVAASPAPPARSGSSAPAWLNPVTLAVLLTAGVLALDALIPGLPDADRGWIGRLSLLMSGICPQRPSHSYTLGGVQLPLEARMMGIFGGFLVSVLVLATMGRKRMYRWPRLPIALVLLLGVGIMGFDGFNALFFDLRWLHAYTPDLRLRLGTGLLTGMAAAFFLVPTLAQVGTPAEENSAAPGWRDVGWVAAASALFGLLVASGWQALLVPVAFMGVGGVVVVLFAMNRVILWGLTGARPILPGQRWQQWGLGILAVGLAIGELVLLALLYSSLRETLLAR